MAEVAIPLGFWLVGMTGCQDRTLTPPTAYSKDRAKDEISNFKSSWENSVFWHFLHMLEFWWFLFSNYQPREYYKLYRWRYWLGCACRGYKAFKVMQAASQLSEHKWPPVMWERSLWLKILSFEGRFKKSCMPPFSKAQVRWTDTWHFQGFFVGLKVATFVCAQGLQNKEDHMLERCSKDGFYLN